LNYDTARECEMDFGTNRSTSPILPYAKIVALGLLSSPKVLFNVTEIVMQIFICQAAKHMQLNKDRLQDRNEVALKLFIPRTLSPQLVQLQVKDKFE